MDKPYPITKEIISRVIDLCDSGEVLEKKPILNREVEALTDVKGDQQALIINTIINPMVSYVAYVISYKIYFQNREGATSAIAVYMTHMLVMENKSFDLCELLKELLFENIKMTKEKNYSFQFGSFLVSLVMYYSESLPTKNNVIWESGVPIARYIFRYLNNLANKEEVCNGYFKLFVNIWRVCLVSVPFSSGSKDISFGKKKRRQSVPTSVSKPKRSKMENVVVIEDPKSPATKGVSDAGEQEVGDLDDESDLLKLCDSVDGIQNIGLKWLTSVKLDKIKSILMKHLI